MGRAYRVVIVFLVAATFLFLAEVSLAADDAAQAAARAAQAEHGGRVLKVERKGDRYRVKILKDSGKVKIVFVPKAAEGKKGRARVDAPRRRGHDFRHRPQRASR